MVNETETRAPRDGQFGWRGRFVTAAVPAAVITTTLYLGMQTATAIDYVAPEAVPDRILEAFILPPVGPADYKGRIKPEPIDVVEAPPPPPKLFAGQDDIKLPAPLILGATPETVEVGSFKEVAIRNISMSREIVPLWPPAPHYPPRALHLGIEGTCEVHLDVDQRGRPMNVAAVCTHSIFESAAERAIRRVEFAPRVIRGQAVVQSGVIYPLVFELSDN